MTPPLALRPFSSVLVANRGEIALRIFRTLAGRGLRAIAVHAPTDASALHVHRADAAVTVDSYLDAGSIVAAAEAAGAEAVHPGYGFLSEDPAFAAAVLEAGLVWIGPPPEAIEAMGDKIRAKATVAAAGVPVVPGAGHAGMTDPELADAAREVGLPVLLKPAAGGGGKGMRAVHEPADLLDQIAAARREASGAFGDDTLLVERLVARPRHIEVQVFADAHGEVVHLGERECSLQRRHQKIVEECPSPLVDEARRAAIGKSAIEAARACGYVGAGTVELIVPGDRPDDYFFMEMNTRLQVEHPVTEEVTGVDLVDWQLRVAAGEPLPLTQDEIELRGHAIEARVYAEDPGRGFLPASGTIVALREPAGRPGIRVDSALFEGMSVGTRYDPMLAKIIARGADRQEALARLRSALRSAAVLGVTTNVAHLAALLDHPDVVAGRLDTELVERTAPALTTVGAAALTGAALAAACRLAADLEPSGPVCDPWEIPDGWRIGGPVATRYELVHDGRPVVVSLEGSAGIFSATVDGGPTMDVRAEPARGDLSRTAGDPSPAGELSVTVDGVTARWVTAVCGREVWVGRDGRSWRFVEERGAGAGSAAGSRRGGGRVTSPMPGVVVAVHAEAGDRVSAGQPLVAVEAMKMEHVVVAPSDGVVAEMLVRSGQTVALDELLVEMEGGDDTGGMEGGDDTGGMEAGDSTGGVEP